MAGMQICVSYHISGGWNMYTPTVREGSEKQVGKYTQSALIRYMNAIPYHTISYIGTSLTQ